MNSRIYSLIALGAAVAGLVVLIMRHELFSVSPVGIGIQAAALALMLWARVTFGGRSFHAGANPTEGGLVTHGPYRFFRHPIYAAVMYFVWAGVLSAPTPIAIALATLVTLGMGVRMLLEERLLVQRYPEYAQYARATKRLVPYLF